MHGLHNGFIITKDDFFQIYDRSTFNRQNFFDKFIKRQLNYEIGSQFKYNNVNYNMLTWASENTVRTNLVML